MLKMNVKMSKINMFNLDLWTIWSKLSSFYAFYIVPSCIRNHHIKFKIDRTTFIIFGILQVIVYDIPPTYIIL